MKRIAGVVVGLISLLVVATPSAHAVLLYSGSLSAAGGGLTATEDWNSASTTFSWTVDFDNSTSLWTYDYTYSVPRKGVSHVIVELSPDVEDLETGTTSPFEIDTYSGDDPSNPGMPGPMYGVKFDGAGEETFNFTIVTARAPVWGDVYGKDGKSNGNNVIFYNDGFLAADPTDPPSDGSVNFHILRPDTEEGPPPPPPPPVIPEPSSLLLMGTGLMGTIGFGGARKLRIRKKKEVSL